MSESRLSPLGRLAVCLLGLVLIQFLVMEVIETALKTTAILGHQDFSQLRGSFWHQNFLLINFFFYPPTLIWLYVCRRVLDNRSFISLGLRGRHAERDLGLGLIGGCAAVSFLFGTLWITGNANVGGWSAETFTQPAARTVSILALWLLSFVIVGFMEELVFRGYILHNLAGRFGLGAAISIQALLFGVIHAANIFGPMNDVLTSEQITTWQAAWNNDQIRGLISDYLQAAPNLVLIAIFFALCYLKTGSLWFPIGFHAAWNFFLGCIFSFPVSGLDIPKLLDTEVSTGSLLTGGSFGPEGSLLLTPIIVAMIYVMLRQLDHPQATLDLKLSLPPLGATAFGDPEMPSRKPIPWEGRDFRPGFKTRFGATAEEQLFGYSGFSMPQSKLTEQISPFAPAALEASPTIVPATSIDTARTDREVSPQPEILLKSAIESPSNSEAPSIIETLPVPVPTQSKTPASPEQPHAQAPVPAPRTDAQPDAPPETRPVKPPRPRW